MKLLLVTLLLAAAYAGKIENPAYGYLEKYGIPQALRIREAEEAYHRNPESRIVGGLPATLGQYPHQAGLLIDVIGFNNQAVCGAVLVSLDKLLTAAHCWNDGRHQGWRVQVVLGSVQLFFGGERVETSVVVPHYNWQPALIRNDIAVIYLPYSVYNPLTIYAVRLPSGPEVNETFAGEAAIATGFGLTSDGGSLNIQQSLSHVRLNVISNSQCSIGFPFVIQPSNICTRGVGGVGTCSGDSGGPLTVQRYGEPLLIGITSFGSAFGCELVFPSAFARVTSYMDFIRQHVPVVGPGGI